MVTISGVFLDPDGAPVAGAAITFIQLKNTKDSFLRREAIMTTAEDGSYSVQLYNGRYKVMAKYQNNSEAKLGEINVSDSTGSGSLNDYLLVGAADNTPSALFLAIEKMYFDMLAMSREPAKKVDTMADLPINPQGYYLVISDEEKGGDSVVPVRKWITLLACNG
ncbi:phage tail fiber protein [Citrobacter freundii]|nr:phage tail fiber protein [Citrobacter freundii]